MATRRPLLALSAQRRMRRNEGNNAHQSDTIESADSARIENNIFIINGLAIRQRFSILDSHDSTTIYPSSVSPPSQEFFFRSVYEFYCFQVTERFFCSSASCLSLDLLFLIYLFITIPLLLLSIPMLLN